MLSRSPLLIPLLVAALLCLPTLPQPLWSDDYIHQLIVEDHLGLAPMASHMLSGKPDPLGVVNLFSFFSLTPEQMQDDITSGALPWWALPELRITFWRPLSSALHVLDHQLFARAPFAQHLHSAAWYLALVSAVGLLFRRAIPGLAGLALLLFAVDDAHWMPMGWVANRNALVAATPALLGLVAHMRWREEGWRPGAWLGPLGVAVGAAGGEPFLGVMAFFLTYEALGAPGAPRRRLLALAGPAGVALVWAALYRAFGFGASGSALYIDPVAELPQYLAAAAWRAPALLGAMLSVAPSDLTLLKPELIPALSAWGVICCVTAGLLLRAMWPSLAEDERRALRWLLPGVVLSLAPVLSTFPLDRLLLVPSVGGAVLVAATLRWCWTGSGESKGLRAGFGGLVALSHLVMPLPLWVGLPVFYGQEPALHAAVAETAFLEPATLGEHDVVIFNASDPTVGMYFPVWWLTIGQESPAAFTLVSPVAVDHRLTRTGDKRFELELMEGGLHDSFLFRLMRSPSASMSVGHEARTGAARVTVLEVGDAGPRKLGVELFRDPDGDEVILLAWRAGALSPLPPLAVGESLEIPWSPGPRGL